MHVITSNLLMPDVFTVFLNKDDDDDDDDDDNDKGEVGEGRGSG